MNINLQESKEQEISCSKDKNNTNDKQKDWNLIDATVCVELCCYIERFCVGRGPLAMMSMVSFIVK